jgi:hypothetical protein
MLKTRLIQITIARDYDAAYAILSVPRNFLLWSPILETRFEPRGNNGLDWLVDLPSSGTAILRFSAPNEFGVLDYSIRPEGGARQVRTTHMRLVRNDDGCELIALYFQMPGQDDESFASYTDWARNDLMVLKSVVEAHDQAAKAPRTRIQERMPRA